MDDDDIIDNDMVISAIKEYLDSIGEGTNFAVISNVNMISIRSIYGKTIKQDDSVAQPEMFSCTHCGFVTRYQVELNVHMRIHYM